jgi:hypothetical protein
MSIPTIKERQLNQNYGYRTDVPATIYRASPFSHIEWRLARTDTRIRIPLDDLRRALQGAPTRNNEGKRILFGIDPVTRTVRPDGKKGPSGGPRPAVPLPTMEVI